MKTSNTEEFQNAVLGFYTANGRHDLPWRLLSTERSQRFYEVWISEMMLQQTGVNRVVDKYREWMLIFPDLHTLASRPLGEAIRVWQGLGYNRRAAYVHKTAVLLARRDSLPTENSDLVLLPGIGRNTAAAILSYTDDLPQVFIETNIRTVFIYHFFKDIEMVNDVQLEKIVEASLPINNFREWYWALMDYGSYLKKSGHNQLHKVSGYKPQSRFEGSQRQIRGSVLRILIEGKASSDSLRQRIDDERLSEVLIDLVQEGLINIDDTTYYLP